MARIARDRDEKETAEREAAERERLKNMTEEERIAWEAANPKVRGWGLGVGAGGGGRLRVECGGRVVRGGSVGVKLGQPCLLEPGRLNGAPQVLNCAEEQHPQSA